MPVKIDSQVIAVLKTVKVQGNGTTMPQLDRKLYERTNKILELLGGKWNKKSRMHEFDGDPGDRLNDAVTTGEVIDAKKEFQFFETPPDLAERMVELAHIKEGHSVLEPSAGNGAILKSIRPGAEVVAVELDKGRHAHINKTFFDGSRFLENSEAICTDFLTFSDVPGFDRIVMNPPFRNGQDIVHLRHAYRYLKTGGRMVAITAPGWTFRNDSKHLAFRDWVTGVAESIEELPENTFKSSGTSIRTMLLVINK